jgi:hypothetical protein
VYLDDENAVSGTGEWLYVESNGVWVEKGPGVYLEGASNANLQRGGSSQIVPNDDEICIDESGATADGIPPF